MIVNAPGVFLQRDVGGIGPHRLPVEPELAIKPIVGQEHQPFAGCLRLDLGFPGGGLIAGHWLAIEAGQEGIRVIS